RGHAGAERGLPRHRSQLSPLAGRCGRSGHGAAEPGPAALAGAYPAQLTATVFEAQPSILSACRLNTASAGLTMTVPLTYFSNPAKLNPYGCPEGDSLPIHVYQ